MSELWNTAERLRTVNAARKRFITLWAIDQAYRLFDLQWQLAHGELPTGRGAALPAAAPAATTLSADACPALRSRWAWLYRGSILDD